MTKVVFEAFRHDPKLRSLYEHLRDEHGDDAVFSIISEEVEHVRNKVEFDGLSYSTDQVSEDLYVRFKTIELIRLNVECKRQTTAIEAQRLREAAIEREVWQNKLLYYFSRFCGPANRENIQFMQRDLILESRDMQKAQHNKWFIATALTWRALFGGILPIMSDGLLRLIKPVKEAKDIAKKSGD